ncbi:MAG: metallophosphoesterase [Myxococcales bacterium]|nr:MAG: metallophosphoesterase [Myxococcales bacterium]
MIDFEASSSLLIGVVSDTHGLVRPELLKLFAGVDCILHAGDVGEASVLRELERLAPLCAVRGNVDRGELAAALPFSLLTKFGGLDVYMLHDISELDLDPRAAACSIVVYGHTHRPLIEKRDDVLYLNPGSAGPRRFSLPVSCARLRIEDGRASAELLTLLP